jgi:hypothetical protein
MKNENNNTFAKNLKSQIWKKNKNPSEFVFENNYDNFNFKPINSSNI